MKKMQLFISYSHKNDTERQEFDKWLAVLKEKELVDAWYDGRIAPGDQLQPQLDANLEAADIIVLMLSQDYLSSRACRREMDYALNKPQVRSIPIILKECTWKDTGCRELLALPKDGRPIDSWPTRDQAWHDIYEGIKHVVEQLQNQFDVREDFLAQLHQLEFVTQSQRKVTLPDLFVFPSLSEETGPFRREAVDFNFFLEHKKPILIRGREFSGKSALLKWLFTSLSEKFNPILLDGDDIHKTVNFDNHLKREFSNQRHGDFERWMRLDKKVALIDNFHHNISSNIFAYLQDNFVMTIVSTDDDEYLLYFKDDPVFVEYTTLTIGQFDLAQQEELIRNWFRAGQQSDLEIADAEIDKLEGRVNNVITRQRIVPRYPFYILSILQSLESFMPSDIRITSYGHCYQALVTAQLIRKNIKYEDIDTCFNYLRNLSFDIYGATTNGGGYTRDRYHKFREEYKSKFLITEALINKIENTDYPILDLGEDRAGFEYSYLYFFFLGMYLAFNESEEIINVLCEQIHLRQNAFILIFTIHHTQNQSLLETIRQHCAYTFQKEPPAELSAEETQFMNTLMAALPDSIISGNPTAENRRAVRKEGRGLLVEGEGKVEHETESPEGAESQQVDAEISAIEISRGVKILEVLGQILKNRAGSFEKKVVEEILEETIDLGLRILHLFLEECKRPEFERWLTKSLAEAEKEFEESRGRPLDQQQKRLSVEQSIQFFAYMVTIGVLNRTALAVDSEKLTSTMAGLSERKSTPAYDLLNYLISTSQDGISADYVRSLLAKYKKAHNYWAERALSYYVQIYLNTHNVNFRERQKLFDALNLKYLPNKPQSSSIG